MILIKKCFVCNVMEVIMVVSRGTLLLLCAVSIFLFLRHLGAMHSKKHMDVAVLPPVRLYYIDKAELSSNIGCFVTIKTGLIAIADRLYFPYNSTDCNLIGLPYHEVKVLKEKIKSAAQKYEFQEFQVTGFLTFREQIKDPNEHGIAHGTPEQLQPYVQREYFLCVLKIETLNIVAALDNPFQLKVESLDIVPASDDPFRSPPNNETTQ